MPTRGLRASRCPLPRSTIPPPDFALSAAQVVKGEGEEDGAHVREALQRALRRRFFPMASVSLRRVMSGRGSSWCSERRLMSELERTITAGAAERVIRSYISTKLEHAALAVLSRLLMDSTPSTSWCYIAVKE